MTVPSITRPLKIGLQLPEVEYVASWTQHLEMAKLSEAIGLDSLWLGDHLLYRGENERTRGPWECWTMLSALAAVTTKVELGPLVLCTGFRNPAMVAKMAETIDEISGGRFILGLGAGWNEADYAPWGIPFDSRFSRFSEAFTIIHGLIRGGEIDYSGEFYSAPNCEIVPRGPRNGALPLMIGSNGERMLRLTLPHVDAWNIWFADFGNTVEGLRPFMERIDRIGGEIGRNPAEIERTAALLVTAPGGSFRNTGATGERAQVGITGTPREIADTFRSFYAAGISHIQIVLDPITPESIKWLAPVIEELKG